MKISINIDETADDIDISITCRQLTTDIERLLASIRMLDKKLSVTRKGLYLHLHLCSRCSMII